MAIVVISSLAATVGPARAAVPPTQQQPRSTWVQPGSGPLDGLGTFVFVTAPPAGPTQGSLYGYEYTILMSYEDGSTGLMALGYKNGQKVAGFSLMKTHPVIATVPFDWKFGHIYYLLTYRIAPDLWAAWAYDWDSATWTHIASQSAPGIGGMHPASSTSVDYDDSLAPTPGADASTCGFYPKVDAFVYPPTGWRGAAMTQAAPAINTVSAGTCPSVTRTSDGWQWYALGAAAA